LARVLPEAEFFVYAPWRFRMPVDSSLWHARVDPWNTIFQQARGLWMTKHIWMLLRIRSLCLHDKVNVFWATDAPFIPYLPKSVRVVASVYDFRYKVAPQTQRKSTLQMRRLLEKRHGRADALVPISQGTADKLNKFLGFRAVGIARPAVSPQFYPRPQQEIDQVLARYRITSPYLLSVANADSTPHKNINLLLNVFRTAIRNGLLNEHLLVLAGPKSDQLLERFQRNFPGEQLRVIALGYVDGSVLPALYSGADVFVFPSLYEGFGMPVLEARACQTRIVASDITELREAGGDYAIYVKPDAEGVRDGILAAIASGRPPTPDALWTWESSARVIADALYPSS
jgi:glycosyltransferase involved in cell wall biosynthesis